MNDFLLYSRCFLKIVSIILLSSFCCQCYNQTDITHKYDNDLNILFIGNSYVSGNYLLDVVEKIIKEGHPELNVNLKEITYSGETLAGHYNNFHSIDFLNSTVLTDKDIEARIMELDSKKKPKGNLWPSNVKYSIKYFNKLREEKQTTKWDYVVLQSFKDDLNKHGNYKEYAIKWAKEIRDAGSDIILFMTAPHAINETPVDSPISLEKTKYQVQIIKDLKDHIKPAAVVPIALGLKKIQENGTYLTFRYVNDTHPNQYCTFLTANMFYTAIFNESTEGFAYNTIKATGLKKGKDPDGKNPVVELKESEKQYLQKIAYETIVDFNNNRF